MRLDSRRFLEFIPPREDKPLETSVIFLQCKTFQGQGLIESWAIRERGDLLSVAKSAPGLFLQYI